jgi:hypothetical protein
VGSDPTRGAGHGRLSVVSVACSQVEVSASGRSHVQRSPTDCGASECDREASTVRRPWPTGGCWAIAGGGNACERAYTIMQELINSCKKYGL